MGPWNAYASCHRGHALPGETWAGRQPHQQRLDVGLSWEEQGWEFKLEVKVKILWKGIKLKGWADKAENDLLGKVDGTWYHVDERPKPEPSPYLPV